MKQFKWAVKTFAGLAMLVFIAIGAVAYFTTSISVTQFSAIAFVVAVAVLAFAYYGWLATRAAMMFVVTAAVLLIGVAFFKAPGVKSSSFQAVFLTNGQVYFGHLKDANTKMPRLTDIYYLQSNPANPQQGDNSQTTQAQLSLVKLGKELHGPEDSMTIKSDQILFWENLTSGGKVAQAIKQAEQKK